MYETSILRIPRRRALRVAREEYRVQEADGTACTSGTLRDGYTSSLKTVATEITYQLAGQNSQPTTISSRSVTNANLTDVTAVDSYPVNVETRSEYESSLMIESSYANCTEMVTNVEGHMIRMYDTNPNYNVANRLGLEWYSVPFLLMFFVLHSMY